MRLIKMIIAKNRKESDYKRMRERDKEKGVLLSGF